MFTGIVEETVVVLSLSKKNAQNGVQKLVIRRPNSFKNLKLGQSILVDGICLTIDHLNSKEIGFSVSKETLKLTKSFDEKVPLNLERALKFGDRLNGHLVSGHVGFSSKVVMTKEKNCTLDLKIKLPDDIRVKKKSSISINGVSLTINEINNQEILCHIIPETFKNTNLRFLKTGDLVNIELDSSHEILKKVKNSGSAKKLNSVSELLSDIKVGKPVILVDDEKRENEGDLVVASQFITPELVNFMVKNARGLVCVAITKKQAKQLNLPLMVDESANFSHNNTAFTLSVESAKGVSTGISASDRATTIKAISNPDAKPEDVVSPGHIFPIVAKEGGVLKRAGHTEGSVDLAMLAGVAPSAVLCEIMKDSGEMARLDELLDFSREHGIKIGSIADLIKHRIQNESLVYEAASCELPIEGSGIFKLKIFKTSIDNSEHIVLQKGDVSEDKPTLVRVHSQCMTGDVFSSNRCDCGKQLRFSLNKINQAGSGIVLYLRQEGRGIGLVNKIKSYVLQDQGLDTVEANMHLGFRPDERDYGIGAQILRKLNVTKINLMTNNPSKKVGLNGYGLEISCISPIEIRANKHNVKYLTTKREKLGHILKINYDKH